MFRRLVLFPSLLVACVFAVLASGQTQQPAAPPPQLRGPADAAPSATVPGARELRDVPYVTGGHERQRLDLYLPAQSGGAPRPLIVWIHGGGWEAGSKNGCPAKAMAGRGYVVASIGYRLSQHAIFPAQIEDCKAAIRWLRSHAGEYGVDPDRIGVWGASAGGHLAALLGTTGSVKDFDVGENLEVSSRVQCVIDWFGPTDFLHYGGPDWVQTPYAENVFTKLFGGGLPEKNEQARHASPVNFVTTDAAPFLIMQGDRDKLVPMQQSQLLHAALEKAGVETHLQILSGAGHGGPAFNTSENIRLMTRFFDEHLLKRMAAK